MAKKAIVELELQTDSYKASLVEIQKGNTTISESASKAAQTAQAAFTETGKAAKAAFASTEVKKALNDQIGSVDKLTASLEKLYQEEVQLLAEGKKQTDQYKKNQQEANRLRSEIDKLTKNTEQLANAEDKTVKKSQTLTGQLRAMKQELALLEQEGKDGTAQFNQLSLAAARLEDQIGDTRERVRVLASDTFAFDAAVDAVSTLAGGFAAVQGAVGLFAEDNEELQKAIAKTNSALAILNGLQQINAFVTGQSAGKIAIQKILTDNFSKSLGTAAVSLNILKAALAGIGLGLFIAAVTTIIEALQTLGVTSARTARVLDDSKAALTSYRQTIAENAIELQRLTGVLTDYEAAIKRIGVEAGQRAAKDLTPLILRQRELRTEVAKLKASVEEGYVIENGNPFAAFEKRTLIQRIKELEQVENRIAEIQKAIAVQTGQEVRLAQEQEKGNQQSKEANKNANDRTKAVKENVEAYKELNIELSKNAGLLVSGEILGSDAAAEAELNRRKDTLAQLEELEKEGLEATRLIAEAKIKILLQEQFIAIEASKKTAKDQLDNVIAGSNAEKQIIDKKNSEIALIETNTANAINDINRSVVDKERETQEAIRAERKKTLDESVNLAFQYAQEFAKVLSSLNDLSRQNSENTIAEIQRRQAAELEAINNTLDTERQKERQRAALTLRTNQQIALEKQKQAKRDKALAIFEATINTAASIVKTGATLGYPAAIPFQVAAGIVGAAQIAAIAARPIPRFEKGGKVGGKRHSQGGTLIEAEVDEFITRRGQSIRHRSELEAINRSTAEYHRLIQRNYVRPAIARVLADRKQDKPTFNLNATLNSKKMEGELKGLRKDIRRSKQRNYTNQTDSRYQWHNN